MNIKDEIEFVLIWFLLKELVGWLLRYFFFSKENVNDVMSKF